ncbi:MAG: tol-pal system-associated acyl-CoA thioesterase [Hyphomicrobiaceae bacterium]
MSQASQQWPDLAGRLVTDDDGRQSHRLAVRVYFEDTDFSGVVYHATYLRWCERGRSDFLRLLGNDHQALLEGRDGTPAAFVVRRMNLDFKRPARIDDVIEVQTRVAGMSTAVLTLEQTVTRDGVALFEARVEVVLVSLEGKPQRLSSRMRDVFSPAEG